MLYFELRVQAADLPAAIGAQASGPPLCIEHVVGGLRASTSSQQPRGFVRLSDVS